MQILSLSISLFSILIFSFQLSAVIRSKAKRIERLSLLVYFSSMLVWQIAGIGVILSGTAFTAGIFYRIYMPSSTGFLYCLFPLSLSLTDRKAASLWTLVTMLFYALNIILGLTGVVIENLYLGASGFYVPELNTRVIILNSPVMVFLAAGVVVGVTGLSRTGSSIRKNRLRYFLFGSGIIFIGLATNLTFLKEYPADLFSAMLGGLILSYSVLRRRPVGIRKLFFRTGIHLLFMVSAASLTLFLILLFAAGNGRAFPAFTVIPVLMGSLVVAIMFFRAAGYDIRQNIRRIINPESMVYRQKLRYFASRFRKAVEFSEIYIVYRNSLIDYFPLSGMMIFLQTPDRRALSAVYSFGIYDGENFKQYRINRNELADIFTEEGFLLPDEPGAAEKIAKLRELIPVPDEHLPDIVIPLKINEELLGFTLINFIPGKNFTVDEENLDYLGSISGHALDAISRAAMFRQLEDDLFNKGNLIKDINHRVKNNLQMITALLSMQALETGNSEARDILETAGSRISTIAGIHEMLYMESSAERINLKTYVEAMVSGFRSTGPGRVRIRFELEIDEVDIEPDKALTFCLAVNELITNAVKYAFTERAAGVVRISVREEKNILHCTISDNGSGIDRKSGMEDHRHSLGFRLVENFIVKQLNGQWKTLQDNGTVHDILIPL